MANYPTGGEGGNASIAQPQAQPVTIDGVPYYPDPNYPGVYVSPWGQRGYLTTEAGTTGYTVDANGNLVPTTTGGGKKFNAIPNSFFNGSGGGASYPPEYMDPRYWDLQYAQLQQQYVNAGLDAESARRQALATLLTSRNAQQVNLAGEEANAAAKAADFAANPRDAVAELMYRNAVGGSTPMGSTNNPQFGQYTTALQDKFQSMFGGGGDAFKQAQNFLNQPPPSEYLQPAYTGPGSQYINSSQQPQQYSHGGSINFRLPRHKRVVSGNITGSGFGSGSVGQFSHGGMIDAMPAPGAPRLSFGYAPSSSEGGTNMNIHEPSVVMGMHSGHVYATMAEHAPEQMIIKPLPSVQKAQKRYEGMTKQMMAATQNANRNDAGGTITYGTDPSQFIEELRKQLLNLSPGFGGVGAAGNEGKLPDLRLLAGAPANLLSEDPALQDYMLAGYSSMGIDPRTAMATIQKFTPNAPINNIPRIAFA